MREEIHQQPAALERTLARWPALCELALARPWLALLVGRGTSDHAGIYGQYLLELRSQIPASQAAITAFTLYQCQLNLEGALAVAISQSGDAPDLAGVLGTCARLGATTLAITNRRGSPLEQIAKMAFTTEAGLERAVPATKTYTCQLAAMLMISSRLAGMEKPPDQFKALPAAVEAMLKLEGRIIEAASQLREQREIFIISRGYNFCTALEVALKLQETCQIGAKGFSSTEFLHGPVAMMEPGAPVMLLAPSGATYPGMLEMAARLAGEGAWLMIVSDLPEILRYAQVPLTAPGVEEFLSPVTYVVAGQLLAAHLAEARGLDPDSPPHLQKVTRTGI